MGHVAPLVFDPKLVLELVRQRNGDYPFEALLQALQASGFYESASRELIWHALALGLIEFTGDRSSLRLGR
jgi:hypothetical protein